jgi:hypothetical protein
VATPDATGRVDTRGNRSTRTAQRSTARKQRKLENHCNKNLANKKGPADSVASPAYAGSQFNATTPHPTNTTPPGSIEPGMKPDLSEISQNDLEEPWEENWCPVALGSSKSVSMSRNFDTLRHLAHRTSFTGHGAVTPDHRSPATVVQKRKKLPPPPPATPCRVASRAAGA